MNIHCIILLSIHFCGLKMAHSGRNMSSSFFLIGLFPSRCVRMANFIELNLLYTTQLTVVILQLAVE